MQSLHRCFNFSSNWLCILLISAVIYIIAVMIILIAQLPLGHGATAFPPVAYIAQQLNISAGQQLPKGVIWNGRPYFFYVVSAKELANGKYAVIIGTQ